MGMGAFLGGMITLTPECLQPRMAPPLASTMKLTRNLQQERVRRGRRSVEPVRRSALARGVRGVAGMQEVNTNCYVQNVDWFKIKRYYRDSLPSMFDRKVFTKA